MLKTLFLILMCATALLCHPSNADDKITPVHNLFYIPTKVTVGAAELFEKTPKLVLKKSSKQQFLAIQQKPYITKPKIRQDADAFYVPIASQTQVFQKYRDLGAQQRWNGFEFNGYYPTWNVYAVTKHTSSESIGFGERVLIDKQSGNHFAIESITDGAPSAPIPSPDAKYAVYFDNDIYEDNGSYIRVLKIDNTAQQTRIFTEYAHYDSKTFKIQKIDWQSNTVFVVKALVTDSVQPSKKRIEYYTVYL